MENKEDVWEVLNEWEQIPPPYSATPNTAQWDDDDDDTVVVRDTFTHSSIFPPINHEGLPVIPQPPPQQPTGEGGGKGEEEVGGEVGKKLRERLGVLRSGIVRLAHRVGNYAVCEVGLWSIAAATSGTVALVLVLVSFCSRMQRWRRGRQRLPRREDMDNLMLLIKEKDKRINQLLLQIAQMDEILSASRRVPVFRVVEQKTPSSIDLVIVLRICFGHVDGLVILGLIGLGCVIGPVGVDFIYSGRTIGHGLLRLNSALAPGGIGVSGSVTFQTYSLE
ncbi:hypothetical protein LguiB_024947 [Lonicera macranthoides]